MLIAMVFAACTGGEDQSFVDPEVCGNGVDDDADGLTDCADDDCRQAEVCAGEASEHCYDLIDNDEDGDTDCDDPECQTRIVCTERLETCTSGTDDDGDGLVDCADDDCTGTIYCTQTGEHCTNGEDDDGDGDVDCDDANCANTRLCGTQPESCSGGIDEDGDGQVDCDDADCSGTLACVDTGELCTNRVDDDGDGRVDCLDPDCAYTSACLGAREDCENGIDDDGDGLVDCADDHCRDRGICQASRELCDNGTDDDGDGQTDCEDADCIDRGACEICGNDVDDDGNGAIDCSDSACWFSDGCACQGEREDTDGNGIPECYEDTDGDGVFDPADNCPQVPNPGQEFPDGATSGDGVACLDSDDDGVPDRVDNCPQAANPSQVDRDDSITSGQPVGDVCDTLFNLYQFRVERNYMRWYGSPSTTRFGESIAMLEDYNGDQQNDLLVGSPSEGDNGAARIFFGPASFSSPALDETDADVEFRYADQGAGVTGANLGLDLGSLGDVNGDGLTDVVLATQGASIRRVYIFYGGPTGSLDVDAADVTIDLTAASAGTQLLRFNVMGDVDDDGVRDLFVSSDAGWLVFTGAQLSTAGTLTGTDAAITYTSSAEPSPRLFAEDLVGDGTPELVRISHQANSGDGRLSLFLAGDPTTDLFASTPTDVLQGQTGDRLGRGWGVGGDLDANGDTDLFVASSVSDAGGSQGQIEVFDVASTGPVRRRVIEPGQFADESFGGPIRTQADLSGDGTRDLVATSVAPKIATVTVILGEDIADTSASEAPTMRVFAFEHSDQPLVVTRGEWTGDQYPDLLIAVPEYRSQLLDARGGIFVWPNVWHKDIR